MKKEKGIIVIGGHVQGLGITRIFGKRGFDIVLLDTEKYNLTRNSKYCKTFIKYNKDQLFDKLMEIGNSGLYKNYLILPTNDLHVGIISKNKDILSRFFTVGTSNWKSVEMCYNKRITYSLAKEIGIPIAQTDTPDTIEELEQLEPEFPCIIKPAIMHSFYSKLKTKVFVCKNKDELINNYKRAIEVIAPEEVIVQSIINGESEHLYSACFLFDEDKDIISFVARRARQHPPDFGNATTFAQIVDNDYLIEISKKLLSKIKYRGVCEVEYKYDEQSNEYKFLEINPRTWKWHLITETANINLLENYYNLLTEKKTEKYNGCEKSSFRHLMTDLPMIIKYKLTGRYKKYDKYPVKYGVFDINDIKPFLAEIFYLPILMIKR